MAIVQSDANGPDRFPQTSIRMAGGVFRSEDGGEHWTRQNDIDPRPFYFSQIRIDPANDQRVYVLGMAMLASDDGGKTFREDLSEKVHPDCHALVIEPGSAPPPPPPKPGDKDDKPKPPVSARLLLGTDGGVYQSFQAGRNWDHVNRFACGQYYRVTTDDSQPFYRIAGGLQDNSNFVGPSATNTKDGIVNTDWMGLTGADGFYTAFDPEDKEVVYAEAQEGIVFRVNLRTGEGKELHPGPGGRSGALPLRLEHAVLRQRPPQGDVLPGRQPRLQADRQRRAFRRHQPGSDQGRTRQDHRRGQRRGELRRHLLARGIPRQGRSALGGHGRRTALGHGERGRAVDRTHRQRARARRTASGSIVSSLSAKDPNVAYAVFSAYRLGDDEPMIYRTADLGKTWQSVVGEGLPKDAPVQVVCEDPENPRLLYAGTQAGLFASFDQGGHWVQSRRLARRGGGRPEHPETHGGPRHRHPRIEPLRPRRHAPVARVDPEAAAQPAHLFSVRPVEGAYRLPGFSDWDGKGELPRRQPGRGRAVHRLGEGIHRRRDQAEGHQRPGSDGGQPQGPGTPGLNPPQLGPASRRRMCSSSTAATTPKNSYPRASTLWNSPSARRMPADLSRQRRGRSLSSARSGSGRPGPFRRARRPARQLRAVAARALKRVAAHRSVRAAHVRQRSSERRAKPRGLHGGRR